MRYTEARERSAEVLRAALGRMGQHDAAFNPVTFTVWYEYMAGINPALARALDAALQGTTRLDDAAVARLYRDHVADVDAMAMERLSGEFRQVMAGIADSATLTGHRAGAFGDQLEDLSSALRSQDLSGLPPRLSEALAGTAEMKHSAQALQQQVATSRGEIERLQADLSRARDEAQMDPLTRILNRKGFDQRLHAMLAEPPEGDGAHCLVMLDIDHFKTVNDTHGHLMGDRVIQALGEILRTSVADDTGSVARYGGEEFAILLPRTTLERSLKTAEAVRARTKAMKLRNRTTQEVVLTITVSGGVASMRQGDDASSLIARADAALYQSKQTGRDRVTCA
jgi:diguanylate cyclase